METLCSIRFAAPVKHSAKTLCTDSTLLPNKGIRTTPHSLTKARRYSVRGITNSGKNRVKSMNPWTILARDFGNSKLLSASSNHAHPGSECLVSRPPYLAVLVADGDRMGLALSQLNSVEEHQQFSQQLSRFAGEARNIVHEQRGVLIYSGGDDVLAFVPVDKCLGCARALHEEFGQLMQPWTERTHTSLTLSVGLAIGHFLENLEDLLDYGRAAERHAKQPRTADGHQDVRDGLAVHLLKRGGGPIDVRANWSDGPEGLDHHLQRLALWFNDRAISGRVAYDLRKIADIYDTDIWPSESVEGAIQRDTLSVMKGKQPRGNSRMSEVEQFIRDRVKDAATLRRLAEELLIARQFAVALRQASHQPGGEEILA